MQGCFTATGENENATLKDKVAVMILGEWKRTVTKYQGCAWISKDQIEKCKTKRKLIREGERRVSNSIRAEKFCCDDFIFTGKSGHQYLLLRRRQVQFVPSIQLLAYTTSCSVECHGIDQYC